MDIGQNFIDRSRAYLADEYRIKLRKTLATVSPELLWWRPNDESNSVGNLVMHLEGNVRQWIVGAIGGAPDVRNRAGEFAAKEGGTREELMRRMEQTLDEADAVLAKLRPEQLTERRRVQARDVSVLDAVYQVVQHFALHLGQIILVAKAQVPGAVKFYEDAGGNARPVWRE
ncbi:MAG TPA: DUF1572 family protein [Gemmatimonadaceae bacterium]|nr:DUF1572 family protein [Gemmatimonadaceae bacterium]